MPAIQSQLESILKITRMKAIIISLFLIFSHSVGFSQNCDISPHHSTSIFIPKGLEQTDDQRQITIDYITRHERCLEASNNIEEQYWLHANLAYNYGFIKMDDSLLIMHAQAAYKINRDRYCKEYVSIHLDSQEDYPFKPHYLDSRDNEKLSIIKQRCLDEFLSKEIFIRKRKEEEKEIAKANSKYNKFYISALEKISKKDQQERKKETIDWDIQNRLDKENRMTLDSLYDIYGFPHINLVGFDAMSNAFMVMHHSQDCEWNRKWTPRFFKNVRDSRNDNITSFYFFRHYNPIDGVCASDDHLLNELTEIDPEYAARMFNFDSWYKQFNMVKE